MRRLSLIIFFVCLMTTGASAAVYWVGGQDPALWNNTDNWNEAASGTGTYRLPTSTDDTQINGNASVTMDTTATVNILRFGVTTGTSAGNQVFNVGTGGSVTAAGTSAALITVGYAVGNPAVVNQTGGLVKAVQTASRLGEVRIGGTTGATTLPAKYNLSGGTLDTEILREFNNNHVADLNDTGGTIVIRTGIRQLGATVGGLETWTQKQSTLAPGGVGEIAPVYSGSGKGTIYIGYDRPTTWLTSGTSAYTECYNSSSGTKLALDFIDGYSYDNISNYGNASFAAVGDILNLSFLGGYVPGTSWDFDVWKIVTNQDVSRGGAATGFTGTGLFNTVNDDLGIADDYWIQTWVSSGGYANTIFRLTYIPEPATIALLGLGLLALVRRPRRK